MNNSRRIGVLISGRGSNLKAILDAIRAGTLSADLRIVISNNADAKGLELATSAGVPTAVLDHRDKTHYPDREGYDRALIRELRDREVDLVCLAGFMRRLSPVFVDAFPNAILNVHPSLLPAFPGVDAQHQALEHGVKQAGATVHLVTAQLDAGPIVLQHAVPVLEEDTAESLSARILEQEHRLYPRAIQLILDGGWRVEGRRFFTRGR